MTDLAVSARFLRAAQPIQYEKAEAEVTVNGVASSTAEIGAFMDQAQRVVLAAVGKSHEFRPAGTDQGAPSTPRIAASGPTSVEPQPSGTETPKVENATPARRGRPPKADKPVTPTADALDAALEAATSQPEPDANKLAGAETAEVKVEAKDLPPLSDEDLQNACAAAADKIGSAKVKALYITNYKVDRVAEIEPEFRRPFLKDLEDLVKKTVAAKAG